MTIDQISQRSLSATQKIRNAFLFGVFIIGVTLGVTPSPPKCVTYFLNDPYFEFSEFVNTAMITNKALGNYLLGSDHQSSG